MKTNTLTYILIGDVDGAHPFRNSVVSMLTTLIDEERISRAKSEQICLAFEVRRHGKANQEFATGGHFAQKAPISRAIRRRLAFVLLQDGSTQKMPDTGRCERNADGIRQPAIFSASRQISRCPDWVWYSHDALGQPINPSHPNAITMIIDQGFEPTEGSSGDDWLSVTQSMRAYLRFSLLGGVIGKQIRNLGYSARVHTNLDGEVLQLPLACSQVWENRPIGEVIVNPFLGLG